MPQKYLTQRMLSTRFEDPSPLRFPLANFFMPWGGESIWWQDTSYATPATANGNSVRRSMDMGRFGYFFDAAADANRPTVNISTGYKPFLDFDGSNHWFYGGENADTAPYNGLLRGGTGVSSLVSFSVSFWVKFSSLAATQVVIGRTRASNAGGWFMQYLQSSNRFETRARVDNGETTPSAVAYLADSPATGTWYRFTVSYDHTVPSLSIMLGTTAASGNALATMSATIGRANAPVRIGAGGASSSASAVQTLLSGSIGEIVGVARASFTEYEHSILQSRGPTI